MELKMLLVKFGIFLIYFMKPGLLAKDTMELSSFTFLWEDAEARCTRQGQILAPGRRYRAKKIKSLMIKENVDAVWLYGWRAVSDINPDQDDRLSTLKVDFSRPLKKQLKMICQFDSLFYDPTYKAESTEIARTKCEKDKATLADVTTEDDVKQITKDMIVDSPHWINSISSQGSKIKQCLVAKLVGDELKYSYEDCSQEYNFICVKGDNIISSFSPLISLKMARFEEFEEEIEKHSQSMTSSSEVFDLFSSSEMPFESSTIDLPLSATATLKHSMTSEVVTPSIQSTITSAGMTPSIIPKPISEDLISSFKPTVTFADMTSSYEVKIITLDVTSSFQPQDKSTDLTSSVESEITSEDVTSSFQPIVTPADLATSVQPIFTSDSITSLKDSTASSSAVVYDGDTSIPKIIEPTPSFSEMLPTTDEIFSEADTFSFSSTLSSDSFHITSTAVLSDVSSTENLVDLFLTSSSDTMDNQFPTSSSDTMDIQDTSIVKDSLETTQFLASSTQIIDSSSVDKHYRESVFVEPEMSRVIDSSMGSDMKTSSITEESLAMESSTMEIFGDSSTSISMDATIFQSEPDTPMKTALETRVLQTKQMISSTSSASYLEIYDTDEPEETQITDSTDSIHMEDVSTILATSASDLQTQDVDIQPSTTQMIISSVSETPSYMLFDVITNFTSTSSSKDYMEIRSTSTYGSRALAPSSLSIHTTSSASFSSVIGCSVIDSTTLCGDILTPTPPYTSDVPEPTSKMSNYITPALTNIMPDAPSSLTSSSSLSSSFSIPSVSMYTDDLSDVVLVPSMSSAIPSITDNYDSNSKEYDNIDENPTLSPPAEQTPKYTIGSSDEDKTYNIDEDIPGDLDKDNMDEDNEVGNASAGEIVEKKEGDEDEGIEVGLWVAFAILITLVLIALILAAFLYRKRKQQKSKDITAASPPAAAGETVELRDSRSPSRENGKPRESATYKDPAYEI